MLVLSVGVRRLGLKGRDGCSTWGEGSLKVREGYDS